MALHDRRVFIDGCAVNRFALLNVDPIRALDGSGLSLALTDDLALEYRRALGHLFVPPYVKTLISRMLACCAHHEAPIDGGSTDRRLVALASAHVVITDDAKLYRQHARDRPGLVAWPDVETYLRARGSLADLVRAHAARMGDTIG